MMSFRDPSLQISHSTSQSSARDSAVRLIYFRTHSGHRTTTHPWQTVISDHFLCVDHTWCLFGTKFRSQWINYVTFTARCHAWLINNTKLKRNTNSINIECYTPTPHTLSHILENCFVHSCRTSHNFPTFDVLYAALLASVEIRGTLISGLLKPSSQRIAYRLDDAGTESLLQSPPSLVFNGYRVLSPEVMLTTHLLLVPRLKMGGSTPLLPLYAFMAWTGIKLPSINLSKTKHNLLHIRIQSVPHSKHFPPRL